MGKEIKKEQISRFRQEARRQVEKLKSLALKAGYGDLLFRGVPCEVFRTCGKETCRCMTEGRRHGPYKVVQVWNEGRSRQVTLKKGEERYFEMAKRYQFQQENRRQMVEAQEELLKIVDAMLKRRTIWEKE